MCVISSRRAAQFTAVPPVSRSATVSHRVMPDLPDNKLSFRSDQPWPEQLASCCLGSYIINHVSDWGHGVKPCLLYLVGRDLNLSKLCLSSSANGSVWVPRECPVGRP